MKFRSGIARVRASVIALAFVAMAMAPSLLLAQDPPTPPTMGDVGIDMSAWIDVITGNWFAIVARVLGVVFIATIIWKGTALFKRRLIVTR